MKNMTIKSNQEGYFGEQPVNVEASSGGFCAAINRHPKEAPYPYSEEVKP